MPASTHIDQNDKRERFVEKRVFNGEEFDVVFVKGKPGHTKEELDEMRATGTLNADPMAAMFSYCAKLNPRTYEAAPGVICEQDVAVRLRDGTTIYADIYRPEFTDVKIPVIIGWAISESVPPKARKTGN